MPIVRAIFVLAFPTILSMLVQVLYNLTDTYFIGKLNDPLQVAAITIALPIYMLQMALAGIFGAGGASYISRLLGKKEYTLASETVSTSILSTILLSLVFGLSGYFSLSLILPLFGTGAQTSAYAYEYLKIILLGSPVLMLNFALSQMVRAEGAAKISMFGMFLGTGLNIILDPIFILYLGMGVRGAAIATLIGSGSAMLYYLYFYVSRHSIIPPKFNVLHIRKAVYWEIFKIGIPASLSQIMMSIGSSISYRLAAVYADEYVAALGVAMRVFSLPIFIFIGLSIGIQPLIGYCYGAKLYHRMRESIIRALQISLLGAAFFIVIVALFPEALMKAFIRHPQVVQTGVSILRSYVFATPFAATGMILMVSLQAMGKALPSLIVALSRQGFIYIPAIFFLNHHWGFVGLVSALPVADAGTVLISATFNYLILKKLPRIDIGLDSNSTLSQIA